MKIVSLRFEPGQLHRSTPPEGRSGPVFDRRHASTSPVPVPASVQQR